MAGCCTPYRVSVACGLVGLVCTVFGVALIVLMPSIQREQVIQNVKLDPTSFTFDLWKDMPIPFFMSVYLFEVLNPSAVLKGDKPSVRQRGPYVYRERRWKENITFNDNGTVSFVGYKRFFYEPDLSNGSEDDYIVIPNTLVLVAAVMLEDLPLPSKLAISATLAAFRETAFINRTVGEVLWGYEDPFLKFLNTIKPGLVPYTDKFGLFVQMNNSNSGVFSVYTGIDDISKAHKVDTWNGLRKVSFWKTDQCNMINGTAGEMWPPFITPSTPLEFYSPDACRSMQLELREIGDFHGIPAYTYAAPKTMFANGVDYPPNDGFCPCRQSGIQNLSSCQENAPLFASHPHFLYGDPELLTTVDGLHPNEQEHGIFVHINPLTGIPVNASVRLQLNFFVKHVAGILLIVDIAQGALHTVRLLALFPRQYIREWFFTLALGMPADRINSSPSFVPRTGSIRPVVLPVIWFEESGRIEGDLFREFYNYVVLFPAAMMFLQFFLTTLGGVLLVTTALLVLRSKRATRKKNLQKPDVQHEPPHVSETTPLLQEDSSSTAPNVVCDT